jgi:integrase/recombinase XerD
VELSAAIAGYLLDLKTRGRSEAMRRLYKSCLTVLAHWLAEQGIANVEDVTINHLRAFVVATQERPAGSINPRRPPASDGHAPTASTLQSYVKAIKVFCGWLVEEEIVDRNPALRLAKPTGTKRLRRSLAPKHIEALLGACDTGTPLGFRDFVLMLVLLDTGLRVSELCNLTLDNVREDHVKVLGKGDKEREVGISPTTVRHLWKYIHQARAAADDTVTVVFTNFAGKPMTPSGVNQMLERLQEAAGITDVTVTAHLFRHTFARGWLDSGGEVMSLSRVMGHSSVKITEIYLEDF